MADPRTDFFASGAGDQTASATDPRTAFFESGGSPETASDTRPRGNPKIGALETIAHVGSAALSLPFQAAASLYKLATSKPGTRANEASKAAQGVAEAMTYQPRTQMGQVESNAADAVVGIPGRLGNAASNAIAGPNGEGNEGLAAAANVGIQALPAVFGVRGAREVPGRIAGSVSRAVDQAASAPRGWGAPATAQDTLTNAIKDSPQSMGAAAASVQIAKASPQLQNAVVGAAQKTGGAVNPDALIRHYEADTLPEPVQLTEGQALQDPVRISAEQNLRGKHPELAEHFNQQNGQLVKNLQAIRDEVGPDVFTTNAVEHGDTLIKAYQDKDAAITADISAKYKALADANGGDLPMDGKTFAQNAQAALKKQMKVPFLPAEIQHTLADVGSGPMTFENFENLRTTLAAAGRKSARAGDGNAEAAIGIVRDQLENMPVEGKTADVKVLADTARSAAKARFDALRADPAYKAAVEGSVPPDRFVQKFVTGGTRDNVARMQEALGDDPSARQTLGVAAVDSLRDAAGIKPDGTGNFTQAGYNKQRLALDPKLKSLLTPEQMETVEKLGNVARYTQFQPRGSSVNNSNTFVAAAAEHAGNLAEGVIDRATGLPLASMARGALSKRAQKSAVRKMIKPGAGLDVLDSKP